MSTDTDEISSTWNTGGALSKIMEEKGITAIQLARAYDCSESYIHRMRNKGIKTLTVIDQLCPHLGVTSDEFMELAKKEALDV